MKTWRGTMLSLALASLISACASMGGGGTTSQFGLYGAQEVPPVNTSAEGSATITVQEDGSISGSIRTTGVQATAAHIHMGNAGRNGKVIIPLKQTSPNTWEVPAGSKLDAEQLKAYKAYGLYVNVHSAAHKGGEIRGQLGPQ
jgi:hypothetical protein